MHVLNLLISFQLLKELNSNLFIVYALLANFGYYYAIKVVN